MSDPRTSSTPPPAARRRFLARICARLGGWCDVLRAAHTARTPF